MSKSYIKEYFNDGFLCPYCGGEVGSIGEPTNHGNIITQDVVCYDCEEEWKEVYELTKTKKIDKDEVIYER